MTESIKEEKNKKETIKQFYTPQSKALYSVIVIIAGVLLLFLLLYPKVQQKIRQDEIENIFSGYFSNNGVQLIGYNQLNDIEDSESELILFFDQNQSDEVDKLLNHVIFNELSTPLGVYPIIYSEKNINETYQLDNQSVFLYLKDGVEVNRFVLEDESISSEQLYATLQQLTDKNSVTQVETSNDASSETDIPMNENNEVDESDTVESISSEENMY